MTFRTHLILAASLLTVASSAFAEDIKNGTPPVISDPNWSQPTAHPLNEGNQPTTGGVRTGGIKPPRGATDPLADTGGYQPPIVHGTYPTTATIKSDVAPGHGGGLETTPVHPIRTPQIPLTTGGYQPPIVHGTYTTTATIKPENAPVRFPQNGGIKPSHTSFAPTKIAPAR